MSVTVSSLRIFSERGYTSSITIPSLFSIRSYGISSVFLPEEKAVYARTISASVTSDAPRARGM
jgi:hypothetical protein